MSVTEHQLAGLRRVSCGVLTVSDTRTLATDTGGDAIVELLTAGGHAIAERRISRDEPILIREHVTAWVMRDDIQAIVATGGTGIANRDSTYEAVAGLFDKGLPGFGELFRGLSYQDIGPAAMLSRAAAGVIANRIVFLLPGSEQAVRLAMTRLIVPELGHIVRELTR